MQPVIETIPLMQMASGDWLSLQLYKFVGASIGKKVYIQANLHGAELAGNAVIQQLITWLETLTPEQLQGEIWLVPLCNPLGVNTRAHNFASGRYNPYDGQDWNRIFWDYSQVNDNLVEFARRHLDASPSAIATAYRQEILQAFQAELDILKTPAYVPVHRLYRTQLQALALDAHYIIDLHSSSNRGLTYLYYFHNRLDNARWFGLDFTILLDDYDGDAFDEAFIKPWLALEQRFQVLGRNLRLDVDAYTLELGTGMAIDPAAVQRGLQGIQQYLIRQGVVHEIQLPQPLPETTLYTRTSQVTKYYAPAGGLIQQRVLPGTWVKPGMDLYQLLNFNKVGESPEIHYVSADLPGLIYDVATNQAVNQGEYVLALMQPD